MSFWSLYIVVVVVAVVAAVCVILCVITLVDDVKFVIVSGCYSC